MSEFLNNLIALRWHSTCIILGMSDKNKKETKQEREALYQYFAWELEMNVNELSNLEIARKHYKTKAQALKAIDRFYSEKNKKVNHNLI